MAILAVDELMLREPRLLMPQQAPLGRVRLDPNHPWRKHVVWAAIPGCPQELVSGRTLTISSVPVVPYQGNPCWEFNNAGYIADTFADATRPFTLFTVASCTNTTRTNGLFCFGMSGGDGFINLDFSGTETYDPLRAIVYGGAIFAHNKRNPTYNKLLPTWAEFQQIGADEYADPYQYRTTLVDATVDRVGTWPTPDEISVGSVLSSSGRGNYFTGYVAMALVLRDAIGIGAQLADDPWQLFIPA